MKIYFVVVEDAKTLTTEILRAFTRLERAEAYMKEVSEANDLVYQEEYDIWTDSIEDDYAITYHIEAIQLEES